MSFTLSSFEQEIMRAIWENEPATVQEILAAVNTHRETPVVRTSVLKQVQRLEVKKCLIRDNSRPARYSALLGEKAAAKTALGGLLGGFFGNSKLRLVKQLLDDEEISDQEVEELSRLIEEKATHTKTRS